MVIISQKCPIIYMPPRLDYRRVVKLAYLKKPFGSLSLFYLNLGGRELYVNFRLVEWECTSTFSQRHVERRAENYAGEESEIAEVPGNRRRGRSKKRWKNCVITDMRGKGSENWGSTKPRPVAEEKRRLAKKNRSLMHRVGIASLMWKTHHERMYDNKKILLSSFALSTCKQ